MNNKEKVLVLGAGVSGLSSGILLLKEGFDVTIWAKDFSTDITSNKASAVIHPSLCSNQKNIIIWGILFSLPVIGNIAKFIYPTFVRVYSLLYKKNSNKINTKINKEQEELLSMGEFTYDYIKNNILDSNNSGCIERNVKEIFNRPKKNPPWSNSHWIKTKGNFKRIPKEELPKTYIDGYEISTIVVEPNIYMDYIMNNFKQLGGKIVQKDIQNIDDILKSEFQTIVNCTGLGSRTLFNDKKVYSVRGQLVTIRKIPGIEDVIVDHDNPVKDLCIITPRIDNITLGGVDQAYNYNLEPNEKDTKDIIKKCTEIDPRLKDLEIIDVTVGLRPQRYPIRIEKETIANKTIVHNYGHGESGFTLSWGCAKKVVDLVKNI